jgi:5-oxoprolinase (ATP-hydrolysing)
MNNVCFGDTSFGYYETICGGAGATPKAPGADAVHTHMTNTRLTDPEVLEHRLPVRLAQFAIRRGSGGEGMHRGGHGVIRRLIFLRSVEVSLLTQRRGPYPPYGLAGGRSGALGENVRIHADGSRELLPAQTHYRAEADEILEIRTPGGGGYGEPTSSPGT